MVVGEVVVAVILLYSLIVPPGDVAHSQEWLCQ
jgi:hypothetical protein